MRKALLLLALPFLVNCAPDQSETAIPEYAPGVDVKAACELVEITAGVKYDDGLILKSEIYACNDRGVLCFVATPLNDTDHPDTACVSRYSMCVRTSPSGVCF